MEMPAEDVCRVMAAGERKDLAIAAGVMYDRLLSTNVCSVAELEWERRSLALLRLNDGAEAAAIISHVHNTPLHQVFSLEQLSRIETMIRAIYPELVASNETDDVIFDRSAAKKALIRRQLFLLRGNVQ